MKRGILSIVWILICFLGFSQEYVAFPDTNAIWNINHDGYYNHFKLRFGIYGDTTINNQGYKKVYRIEDDSTLNIFNMTYYASLRENTNKQIFVKLSDFDEEILIYDFSLNIGDTMFSNSPYGYLNYDICVIADIDSIELENNQFRKRFKISNWGYEYWIEGIGSINGIFHPISEYIIGTWDELLCFKHNDTAIYLNNSICDKCFCTLSTSINKPIKINDNIKYYPNPAGKSITLTHENKIFTGKVTFYSQSGKKVLSLNTTDYPIDISNLKPGLYFVEIKTCEGSVRKKIIVQ